ncbi:MAG: response regulator [Gammaproteobacteria bacterium]
MADEVSVAIVDDDPKVRDSLRLLLSTADIDAAMFGSAEAFLESGTRRGACCLLLDMKLPGMSGIELLNRLQQKSSDAYSVIMITGHGDVPTAVAAMKSGAFHFVEKPFDPDALLSLVQDAFEHLSKASDKQSRLAALAERRESLTAREREVLNHLVDGLPSKLIAHELGISTRTAEHHRSAVMRKMEARTLSHLVRMALDLQRAEQP